jgi:putative ABC transport system permease protein
VIEDLPERGTGLSSAIFASGLASFSLLTKLDDPKNKAVPGGMSFGIDTTTYLRLAPSASIEAVRAELPAVARAQWPIRPPGLDYKISLLRIDEAHLFHGFNPEGRTRVAMLGVTGLLTLLIASINFVNLTTARASRRAREIAVRKTAGASRGALVVQFLGETFLYVALAALAGVALTELLLPTVNAFLQTGARFDYWRQPTLLVWFGGGVVACWRRSGLRAC